MADLWEYDEPVADLDIDVPAWIAQDISGADVAAIIQGGCASGAYMPAATYHDALDTMARYGDDVLDYIDQVDVSLAMPREAGWSWSGLACHVLSVAVELWASSVEDEISAKLDERAEGTNDA